MHSVYVQFKNVNIIVFLQKEKLKAIKTKKKRKITLKQQLHSLH